MEKSFLMRKTHLVSFLLVSPFFFFSIYAAAQEKMLAGRVIAGASCVGIPNLTVRVVPPRTAQNNAEMVTSTNQAGRFQVEIQQFGKYYVAVYHGVRQLYGDVVAVDSKTSVLIPLKLSETEIFNPVCLKGSSSVRLLTDIRPVALGLLPSGMVVLDARNKRLVQARAEGFAKVFSFQSGTPVDIVAATIRGKEVIFSISRRGPTSLIASWVEMLSVRGELLSTWPVPMNNPAPFEGLAIDAINQILYLAGSNQIYRIKLDQPKETYVEQLMEVRSSESSISLGPMAIDASDRKLFVADLLRGHIYSIDLDARRSTRITITSSLNDVRALVLDPVAKRLYVVLPRRVVSVELNSSPVRSSIFIQDSRFRGLSALTISLDGRIWLADAEAKAIHLVSPSGHIVDSLQ